jgi:hypothetical protein
VIEEVDAQQLPGLDQLPCEEEVIGGGRRVPRGMVVKHDDARCMVVESKAENIAGRDVRRVQRSYVDLPLADDPILGVELDCAETLLNLMAVACKERRSKSLRVTDGIATGRFPDDASSTKLEGRGNPGRICLADARLARVGTPLAPRERHEAVAQYGPRDF